MRKLDVKEIHGYDAARGLKLLRTDLLTARSKPARQSKHSGEPEMPGSPVSLRAGRGPGCPPSRGRSSQPIARSRRS